MRNIRTLSIVFTVLQWLGASLAFILSLVIAGAIVSTSATVRAATPAMGILTLGPAMLVNGAVNGGLVLWMARRSSLRGLNLWLQLLAVVFGVQWFQTQVETGYFLPAFPLLDGNFEVYRLVLRGLISSILFTLLTVLLKGGFSPKPSPASRFVVTAARGLGQGAWLAAVYVVLYMVFGYFVAWQSPAVRVFYGGPAELNSFFAQWGTELTRKPELPVFQYFRGLVWLACLVPMFKSFVGRRVELAILALLVLGLLPTVPLLFPNPLMPAAVSLAHFWEVSISTGIFGALCAWFVPAERALS